MLEKEIGSNEQALKYISMINNCLSGLVFTVHNIMELSKIRLNNFKTVRGYINVYEKVNNILEILNDQINQKNQINQNNIKIDSFKENSNKIDIDFILYWIVKYLIILNDKIETRKSLTENEICEFK